MTKPLLGNNYMNQVAIVVHDIESARESFAKLLGIPKPDWFVAGPPEVTQVVYKGKASDSESKLCFIDTPAVQIELIEPNEEPSTMRTFLDQNGEGIHHLAFDVENMEEGMKTMEENGFPEEQTGHFVSGKGRYAYMDTLETHKTLIELLERENKYKPTEAGANKREHQPLLGTDRLTQIAFVVNNLESAAEKYCKLLGVGKPKVIQSGDSEVTQVEYLGQPTEAKAKFMFIDTPLIQFELIEPGDSPSTWKDHLETKGEGIHHLSFVVDNLDDKILVLEEMDCPVIQSGNFYSGKGRYAYMDTISEYKVIIELLEKYETD